MAAEDSAVAAIEHRVRQRILRDLAGLTSRAFLALRHAHTQAPDVTAGELLSRGDVHQALTAHLERARVSTENAVRAGYRGAAQLGNTTARQHLRRLGHTTSTDAPAGGTYLAAVLADVAHAYRQALLGFHLAVQQALDGVGGTDPQAARTLVLHAALRRAAAQLYTRVGAAGAAATHRGYSDAQADAWTTYAAINPYTRLTKTWQVRSANPCAACRALDGVTINLDAQFDRSLGAPARVVGVYADLSVPPRHPYCGCRIVYGFAADTRAGPVPFR